MDRALDMGPEDAPCLGHDESGSHVMTGNVGNGDIEGVVSRRK
jgi:hypothetical protein